MKKISLFAVLFAAFVWGASAQDVNIPEGMEILTPDGVTVTTNSARAYDKDKPLTVSGSKTAGYKLYFTASDEEHGEELWVSDGTLAGTRMVKDIYPGSTTSNVMYITRFKDKVVFQAVGNDDDGAELWISDGTETGTVMIADLNILGGSEPAGFTWLNETQFVFCAKDFDSETYSDVSQRWLWISDGTEEGTTRIKDCSVKYPGMNAVTDEYRIFERVGRKVFFKADTKDSQYGEELWVTDGTEEGTFMIMDINTTVANEATGATAGATLEWFTPFYNQKLFFDATSADYGREPWVTDGTPEGTYMIKDLYEGVDANGQPYGSGVFTPRVYKDWVFFRAYVPYYGFELYKTDFTAEGTVMVADMNRNPLTDGSGTENGSPDLFCVWKDKMWMKAATGGNAASTDPTNYGLELFYSDGTAEGTVMQSDLAPGVTPNAAWEGMVCSGSFYFRAQNEPPNGAQLWELFSMDDVDEFPHKVCDLGPGRDFVHSLRNVNGDLFFTSDIHKKLFRYHYRKQGYNPEVDLEEMDPDFGESEGNQINDIVKTSPLRFYPNPAKSFIEIASSTVESVSVFDIAGRKALSQGKGARVDVRSLPKGAYIIAIKDAAGEYRSKLIVE
ncbi:MAG: T9SS type A sorting domain-containing protein [Dysgonamonadaceae bacterium]|jgi:ELWxxDGT repeat protein|nr:T9SS type A sorting domain-containing protein [Dysgonamonadaceae bacterium]